MQSGTLINHNCTEWPNTQCSLCRYKLYQTTLTKVFPDSENSLLDIDLWKDIIIQW